MLSWLQRRPDLRRLSDEELAARLDTALDEREPLRPTPPPDDGDDEGGWLHQLTSSRFMSFLLPSTEPRRLPMFVSPFLMSRRFREWALYSANARIDALDREIRELQAELERRVEERRQSVRR